MNGTATNTSTTAAPTTTTTTPITTQSTFSAQTYELCRSEQSVSSLLAADPTLPPGEAWEKLFGKHSYSGPVRDIHDYGKGEVSAENLRRAEECGHWGATKPGDLFLRLYHDALISIDEDPKRAMVSPPLMGSAGVVPLTIISVIPDIVRHMANVIVRAEREVYLATNYWQDGAASKYITDAIRELSRRAGERGTKVVMKIIYDRGSAKQVLEPHYLVSEKEYTGKNVNLPAPHEIPNVNLQVMNYHQAMVGTFHAKYMVVDRKIAILQSNNIMDNDNVEMMIHLEGPIVDSLYDMALISWHKKLEPPLPSHNSPAAKGGLGSFEGGGLDKIFAGDGAINGHTAVVDPHRMAQRQAYGYDDSAVKVPGRVDGNTGPQESQDIHRADVMTGPTTTHETTHAHPTHAPSITEQTAQANADGPRTHLLSPTGNAVDGADIGTKGFLADGSQPIPQPQIARPTAAPDALPEFTGDDPHWDDDIAGEVARVQASVSAKSSETQMQAVTRHLNHTTNKTFKGDAPDCAPADEMTPYIPHRTHEPFPMAMVCRSPYGPPTHKAVVQPQNAVWLSAMRNARKNIFIQSPTLNAEPLVPAIMEACERGVDVFCYICLGYNDTGELLPRQGGHNGMIANKLYTSLSDEARQRLHYFWYVAKDQTRPLVQESRKRSCHIKLMIVDEEIGIMGNGNQDTQSWYHSQEINVMLESRDVCGAWIDGLRRNENTHIYGAVSNEDGVWRDERGNGAEGAMDINPGRFSWAKGMVGAVKRVQGVGGF